MIETTENCQSRDKNLECGSSAIRNGYGRGYRKLLLDPSNIGGPEWNQSKRGTTSRTVTVIELGRAPLPSPFLPLLLVGWMSFSSSIFISILSPLSLLPLPPVAFLSGKINSVSTFTNDNIRKTSSQILHKSWLIFQVG